MYLKRVEAVRYGALEDAALGDLGPGLNLCFGANEAGKSTFTALVRHVLYGFPRGRVVERLYLPPAGDNRIGRLIFAAEDGEVVVERTEGVRGGEVTASSPDGKKDGAALVDGLTAGVSDGVFQAVFGFSLEELSNEKSLEDIQSRLYATTTGLEVNPYDVVKDLRQHAEGLWAPRARTKVLHTLGAELRKVREERRAVDEVAERYRTDRARRDEVAFEIEKIEARLRAARVEAERLAALLGEGRRLEEKASENEETASELGLEADRAQREADAVDVDEALLARAEAVERLGTRFELFRSEVDDLRRDGERLLEVERELQRRARDMGESFSLDEASDVHFDLDLENHLAEAEDRLQKLRLEREAAERRCREAVNEHAEARSAALARSEELGLGADEQAREAVGVRMEAADRLLSAGTPPEIESTAWLPGLGSAVIAAVLVVAGLALGDRHLVWAAVLPGLLAAALVARLWWQRRNTPFDSAPLVEMIGLEEMPAPSKLVEIRSRLEGLRQLWATEHQLARKAAAQKTAEEAAAEAYENAWTEWLGWLEDHKLETPSGRPDSVRSVMRVLRDLRTRLEARQELEAKIEGRRAVCRQFVDDALEIGVEPPHREGVEAFAEIEHSVRSVLARLGAARRFDDQRRELRSAEANARERSEAAAKAAAEARKELAAVLERAGLGGDPVLADLEAAVEVAGRTASEIEAERAELLEMRGTLDGRLQRGAEDSESVRLRLAEAGLEERIAAALESYAVHALGARMLEESLETYEAEKQPAVIQRAQEIFGSLTGGRYTRLATPLGRFEPVVSGSGGGGKEPAKLSRATAEQLFLALRLSYIENLSGAHPALPVIMDDVLVNFDDARRGAAVAAIAEFARTRQVIFFSCRMATVAAFRDAAPGTNLVKM